MIARLVRLLGLLLVLTAIALALSRAPDRPVESLVARWALPPSDFIDLGGLVVHLRDQGPRDDPEPIVLLHGTAASLHTWQGWARELSARRRVITLDLPGFGLTGPFAGRFSPDDYRGDTYARFVIELMDRLKLARAVLGGNSLGGEIAWRVATLAPARVAALVLVDASGPAFVPESIPLAFRIMLNPLGARVAEGFLPRALVAQSIKSLYGEPSRVDEALVDRYFELALRDGNRRALALRMRQLEMGAADERLDALKLPVLILWGGRDRLIPPATAEVFRRRIGGSQVVVLDGLGHMPQEEDPAKSVAPVKAFLGIR